jgi:LDH2 family malate/lactate/ureidoglycolate dehydrogenase
VRAEDALAFGRRLLLAHGLPETDAATVADAWSAPISNYDRPQNVGHFFLAMRHDVFIASRDYAARMDRLIARVHANPGADGFSEVVMPGEQESRLAAERSRTSIPYGRKESAMLQDQAAKAGCPAGAYR